MLLVNEKLTAEPAPAASAACQLVDDLIGFSKNTLRNWIEQNHIDSGDAVGMTTSEKQAISDLEKEGPRTAALELDRAEGKQVLRVGGTRPLKEDIDALIDENRHEHGVEPICRTLTPSSHHHAGPVTN